MQEVFPLLQLHCSYCSGMAQYVLVLPDIFRSLEFCWRGSGNAASGGIIFLNQAESTNFRLSI